MAYSPASSSFPTSLDSPVDPSATDITGTFDHAGLESWQNDAIEKLQANVGITSSAVASSLNYKLTNTSSSNPGHKHTLVNGATDVTATAAELNALDGITATVAELNILDGVTSTAAELNILDGVTATKDELNILDGVTSTAAELNKLDGVSTNVTATNLNTLTDGSSYTALHYHSMIRVMGNASSADQNTNNASKPALTVNNGTNQDDTTLDFDASTDEFDEWEVPIPPGITITSATLYIAFRMASATSGNVMWSCSHSGVASEETWDAVYATTDAFAATAVADATTKMKIASKALTTTAWAAGDSLRIKILRDADNASDTATGDCKFCWFLLEIK